MILGQSGGQEIMMIYLSFYLNIYVILLLYSDKFNFLSSSISWSSIFWIKKRVKKDFFSSFFYL